MLLTKFKFVILISTCFVILLVACKKQNPIEANNLYGKWKLIEIYDEYGSGGTQGWHNVSGESLPQIEFTVNGQNKKADSSGGTFQQCSGTYRMPAQNKVEINSTCDPPIENLTVS